VLRTVPYAFRHGFGCCQGERISPAELEMGERAWELRHYGNWMR